jgi:hypothetical protein
MRKKWLAAYLAVAHESPLRCRPIVKLAQEEGKRPAWLIGFALSGKLPFWF